MGSEQLDFDFNAQRSLAEDELLSLLPPGWRVAATAIWQAAADAGAAVHDARINDGALQVDVDYESLDPELHRLLALVVATWAIRSAEMCAACGTDGALWPVDDPKVGGAPVCPRCAELARRIGWRRLYDQFRCQKPSATAEAIGATLNRGGSSRDGDHQPAEARDLMAPLSGDELRRLYAELHDELTRLAPGNALVATLTWEGMLHLGGGADVPGPRALVVGPPGSGKTHVVTAWARAVSIRASGRGLPLVPMDLGSTQTPGWAGEPTIGELLARAIAAVTGDPRSTSDMAGVQSWCSTRSTTRD